MTHYQPGQRVALVRTDDPYTLLTPGAAGTVRCQNEQLNVIRIDWDSGSVLSMLLDEGDQIAAIDAQTSPADDAGKVSGAHTGVDRERRAR